MPTLRPATFRQKMALRSAISLLKAAAELTAFADSPKTTARIRSALKSAGRAERHMDRRLLGHTEHRFGRRVV